MKFKYESRRLGQASFTNGVVGQKVRSVTLKNVENFQSSLCFGSAIILEKKKKDIHEDILDDDVDIKVESKKFDEKISPRAAAIFAGRSRPQTLKNGKFDHKLLHFEVKVF